MVVLDMSNMTCYIICPFDMFFYVFLCDYFRFRGHVKTCTGFLHISNYIFFSNAIHDPYTLLVCNIYIYIYIYICDAHAYMKYAI